MPPRRPFRLNGATLRASPGSTTAGAAITKPWQNGARYDYRVGPNQAIKWGQIKVANPRQPLRRLLLLGALRLRQAAAGLIRGLARP